ncbi:hypothetical protein [Treponema sp.]|uniref:hypothetical protein n=1 Tax=Treponema sp. TaxID=166 RepID=UPI00298E64DB|nr:hypothetical protein [Treponema sp.]MCR5614198.1 hypothetical protein [Treponema sp.]
MRDPYIVRRRRTGIEAGYLKRIMELEEHLAKAKELLDEFLDFESSCMERGIYISDKIRAEAEQFLSEVEK